LEPVLPISGDKKGGTPTMTEIQEQNPSLVNPRVKIVYEGETVDAEELSFKGQGNSVLLIEVGDGAKIELKHEIKNVYRLCDKKKEDGNPIYIMTGKLETRQIPLASKG
jgi:hypothetical protein